MQLEIENLHVRQGTFELRLSLELDSGKLGVIVGPSGCGKSTLLRSIAGLMKTDSGFIRVGGKDIQELAPEHRNIGFVFQDFALFPQLSVRANISFGLVMRKIRKDERERIVTSLANALKIDHLLDRTPKDLSGGEQQRVALARALAIQPDLVLLDEPLSSLDAELRRDLRYLIKEKLAASEATALYVTHDLEEALEMADTLFIMREGSLVAQGKPENLFRYPPDAATARFMGLGPVIPATMTEYIGNHSVCICMYGSFTCTVKHMYIPTHENRHIVSIPGSGDVRVSHPARQLLPDSGSKSCHNSHTYPEHINSDNTNFTSLLYFPVSSVTMLQESDLQRFDYNLFSASLVRVVQSMNGTMLDLIMNHVSPRPVPSFDAQKIGPGLSRFHIRNPQAIPDASRKMAATHDDNQYLRIPCPAGFKAKSGINVQLKVPKTDCILYTLGQDKLLPDPAK